VEPLPIFEVSFSLFKCQDKQLRSTLYTFLVGDCKRIKTKLRNHKQLASIQQYAFQLLRESNETVSKYAIVRFTFKMN
jgi:protein SDA1